MLSQNAKYLHISASSRIMYSISPDFFSVNGNIVIAGFAQARILSELINNKRRTDGRTDFTTPGIINAAALLHELFHFLIEKYEETENPGVLERAYKLIQSTQNVKPERLLLNFIEQFPPKQVLLGQLTPKEYLKSQTGLKQNSEIILEEMLLLYFENINPALVSIKELFDDSNLRLNEDYLTAIETSKKFLKDEKPFGAKGLSLFEFLQMPLIAHPDNIDMQLKYILDVWGIELLDILKGRILSSTDLIYEDAKLFIQHGEKGGSAPAPEYKTLSLNEINFLKEQIAKGIQPVGLDEMTYSYYFEPEQFNEDLDSMPKVVMIAKNIFVWLDQLSKKYNRPITMLHEIPDIELDVLAQYNFNALWLIGVWERSSASKKIKQFCGNHDAVASAYSLYDYEIAAALGGKDAFENLKYRCQARGIRMASDMVPNHTGIYSRCLMENPDYFIQTPVPPYPGYSFSGPDLSENPAFQIRIEDKYYTKNDAAVVFEFKENNSGRV
ncbi:MAG: alpha-amylase, partial [Ignavibacteriales bacterium]|nr:alpha-amylase [Ignavibacteriales bacterium]